jgi:hypothetical protein
MPEGIQDYLTDWHAKHVNHEFWPTAEAWVNDKPNWELLMWIDIYNNYLQEQAQLQSHP